ncbi:MAG: N-acyl-D-amino-acid deacylase family protein [Novosphingobium sp.]|jgi:N-acyl-D-amino-acid deacylase|uniref:N-acyl-D-amino-acid deacylase family protein n=1 Tax=Novosphingobium sp. TaxID=1874826 RepID=UPI00391DC5CE|nr:D-aminoacylase [Novosphingobium sp.]
MTITATRRGFTAGLAALAVSPAIAEARKSGRYDTIVRGGTVFDGLGGEGREADVGIIDGKIATIGNLSAARGALEIDAKGQAVAPGFINMLSWATESLIEDGRSQSDIRQGVTLEVMGEGWSMGPLTAEMKARERREQGDIKFDIGWTTLGQYLNFLEAKGVSCNVASFVGATTLRMHEVGYDDVRASPEQLRRMQDLVRMEMRGGALGVGSSLIYAPGNFANTDELVALTAAAAESGGGYISHMRSEAERYLESIDELIEIGRRAKARVQMYHIKPAGKENWHKADAGLARMDAARQAGIDVSANLYTYTAGSTGLYATMPLWVQQGGHDAWVARLKDPVIRARVLAEMRGVPQGWENLLHNTGSPEGVLLIGFKNPALKPLTGKTLAQVAAMRGTSPEDTIIDLVIEDDSRVDAAFFLMSEENIKKNIRWPWTMLGSDAGSMAPEGKFMLKNTHPRAYGNFARFLGKYIREEKVIGLAEGIRRLTSLPAQQAGIRGRGRLAAGHAADVVVFDPSKIADTATYDKPHSYAVGVSEVLVNGTAVLRSGEHTDARPGKFVKGPGWKG